MTEFVCKVGDTSGRTFQQLETAQSETEARQRLVDRGLFVFSVRSQFDLLTRFSGSKTDSRIRPADFLIFNQQFSTLIKAGLPILKALDLLAERAAAPRLRPILRDVRQRVRDGALLSEALAAQGSFPAVYVTAVTAGERSGNLTGVIDQYISYLRVSTGFRRALATALIYPAILVLAVIVIVTYLVTYAMPQFSKLYQDLGVPLPNATRILLDLSVPFRNYFFVFAGVFVFGFAALYLWTRTLQGALAIDRLKPKVPVLGDIWLKGEIAQFVRTLATLLAGGTPLVSGLQTSSAAIGSRLIATSVEEASERVREGKTLSESLAETHLVPPLALEMIEVGEASGALPAMLTSVAEFYEEEVATRLQRTLVWVTPAILVVMAVVIGFILISLYLPLFSLQIGSNGG
ncbi:MAG TPA: type II secretion system F family protein [Candidatus Binatus sp.]|jgi:type IV pilus assembly protein PilC|nr:type II secretion system F family protein [Candidatus Binatus sp.]